MRQRIKTISRSPPALQRPEQGSQGIAPREGWRYQHVQAIIVAIDQYAEAALGNREFFLNKPHGIGGHERMTFPDGSVSACG